MYLSVTRTYQNRYNRNYLFIFIRINTKTMCILNSDCPQGQRCDSESGQCVPAGHPPGTPIKPGTEVDSEDAQEKLD